MRALHHSQQEKKQCKRKYGLVKLRRMPRDAITKINSPRQRCRGPVRVIRQPAKTTSDAPDRKSQRNWCGKQISRRRSFANSPLYQFDGKQSADQPSHDRLPGHQIGGVVPMRDGQPWILEPEKYSTSYRCPGDTGRDHRPSRRFRNCVAQISSESEEKQKAKGVGQNLEEQVSLD